MVLATAMASLLLLSETSATPLCSPIPGFEDLVEDEGAKYIVIGELHGTNEIPALFLDAVCQAAEKRTNIIVGVEQPSFSQAAIDQFLSSDDSPEAIERFRRSDIWNGEMKDGRSSEAYFKMFQSLKKLRLEGKIRSVVAFQPAHFTKQPTPEEYEKAMAATLAAGIPGDATVIALVGNSHSMTAAVPWEPHYLPMAAHLPMESTRGLNVTGDGGEAWNCMGQPMKCGAHPISPTNLQMPRGLVMSPEGSPYSGTIYLGSATTASPPAVP